MKKVAKKTGHFFLYSILQMFKILYHFSFIFQKKIKTLPIPVSSVLYLFFANSHHDILLYLIFLIYHLKL